MARAFTGTGSGAGSSPAVTADEVRAAKAAHGGVIFSRVCLVHRVTYAGRDIIARNSEFIEGVVDDRGYVPVERWIMSITQAENPIAKRLEGISMLRIGEADVPFTDAMAVAEADLLGSYAKSWPLTKVLDIGGPPVKPSFADEAGGKREVPGYPDEAGHCHIAGGKLEAYFFPRVDVAPYNKDLGEVITRLGLKADTTPEALLAGLKRFALDDSVYDLLNVFPVNPYDSWVIQPGVVHAPGPWLTFEIQRPQDDANLLAWQLGKVVEDDKERDSLKRDVQLCKLPDEEAVMRETVDWDLNLEATFEKRWHRRCEDEPLHTGDGYRVLQIFQDYFYGEAIELQAGAKFTRDADERPYAGIVWSGTGSANGRALAHDSDDGGSEFLVTPGSTVEFANTGDIPLLIYTVFPIPDDPPPVKTA